MNKTIEKCNCDQSLLLDAQLDNMLIKVFDLGTQLQEKATAYNKLLVRYEELRKKLVEENKNG